MWRLWKTKEKSVQFNFGPEIDDVFCLGTPRRKKYIFTLLRAHLPNQTNWILSWVFCQLLPSIYSQETLSMIQVIITDGDSQEINQLDAAIDEFFIQAKRVQCGYHMINRWWKNRVEKYQSFPPSQVKFYESIKM